LQLARIVAPWPIGYVVRIAARRRTARIAAALYHRSRIVYRAVTTLRGDSFRQ